MKVGGNKAVWRFVGGCDLELVEDFVNKVVGDGEKEKKSDEVSGRETTRDGNSGKKDGKNGGVDKEENGDGF